MSRVGRTVRRRVGPWTPAVHALLRHLENVGFEGAPRVLGIDEQGREILTFIAGVEGRAAKQYDDETLAAVARLIRRFHEAVATFVPPPDCAWRSIPGAPRDGIICHNDLAPYNAVYDDRGPIAFIDWDTAAPAPPAWDLAYAAWRFVPLYPDEDCLKLGYPLTPRGPRLRRFCDAYGLDEREGFVDLIRTRQQVEAGVDRTPTAPSQFALRCLRYLDSQRDEWERDLR